MWLSKSFMKKHCVAASNPFSVPQSDLTLVGHPPFSLTTSTYDFATTTGLLFDLRPYDLQPKHLTTKSIDTCVDWESIRFQFVISVDMPAVVWTWVHVSLPLQSMPASHFTTVGIHFLQQSLKQMPGNCIALPRPRASELNLFFRVLTLISIPWNLDRNKTITSYSYPCLK